MARNIFKKKRELTLVLRKHIVTRFVGVTSHITIPGRIERIIQLLQMVKNRKELSQLDLKDIRCHCSLGLKVLQPSQNRFQRLRHTLLVFLLQKDAPSLQQWYRHIYHISWCLNKRFFNCHLISCGPQGPRKSCKEKHDQPIWQRPIALQPYNRQVLKRPRTKSSSKIFCNRPQTSLAKWHLKKRWLTVSTVT